MKTRKPNIQMVPPDGGWGWLIVLGSSLINFSTRAIEPSFGMLFGDLLKKLGAETTGASLVISTLDSIVNFSGLFVGPLIKRYTYRKVAIIGGILSTAAILLTVEANSMLHILVTFGFIGGVGFGLTTACTLVGINEYFSKKKGQAVGLSMAGTAVGFMAMPQIVRILLDEYDFRSALIIIGALSLNAVVGACLFQPVSWHLKPVLLEEEEKKEETHTLLAPAIIEKKDSSASIDVSINGSKRNLSTSHLDYRKQSLGIPSQAFPRKPSIISNVSLMDDSGNSLHIHEIPEEESETELDKITIDLGRKSVRTNKKVNMVRNWWSRFSIFMDLDLLTDGIYLNIIYGLSVCIVAEMNFKLIVPFFLSDLGFTKSEIAYSLSIMAVADICARVIVPPILDRLTFSRRITFLFGTLCVAIGRSSLAFLTTITPIITVLIVIGFFRGISLTTFQLVLTEYATGDNFPSVLGLSMVVRGIFIVVLGPLSGYVRDYTNSYPLYLHFQTALVLSVAISWTIELFIAYSRSKKKVVLIQNSL